MADVARAEGVGGDGRRGDAGLAGLVGGAVGGVDLGDARRGGVGVRRALAQLLLQVALAGLQVGGGRGGPRLEVGDLVPLGLRRVRGLLGMPLGGVGLFLANTTVYSRFISSNACAYSFFPMPK